MDLGTWQTITQEMKNMAEGNVVIEDTCNNTHIINDLELPIVAMGISDSVIIASNDGILVARKNETYKLKETIASINNRPMYERKRWGKYKVLEWSEGALTKKLVIEAGKQISYQYHEYRKEVWTVISGKGFLYLEGSKKEVTAGDVIKIDERMKHGIRAITAVSYTHLTLPTN